MSRAFYKFYAVVRAVSDVIRHRTVATRRHNNIGIQSDGTDRFAWSPLVDLTEGQVMYFTDAGWNAEQHKFPRQINEAANPATTSPSGGAMRYTAPSGGLPAGTVVSVRVDSRIIGEPGA